MIFEVQMQQLKANIGLQMNYTMVAWFIDPSQQGCKAVFGVAFCSLIQLLVSNQLFNDTLSFKIQVWGIYWCILCRKAKLQSLFQAPNWKPQNTQTGRGKMLSNFQI